MKDIEFRRYTKTAGITDDYFAVRSFLLERGYCGFTYARWDWMTTHSSLEIESLSKIGLWEERGKIVALAAFDCQPGETYLVTLPGYEALLPEMIEYAGKELSTDEYFSLVIPDSDRNFQNEAAGKGYVATPEKEFDAIFYPKLTSTEYSLPKGFCITDMKETFDLYQYGRVLWKGFDHEKNGEGGFSPTQEDAKKGEAEMLRPNVDLSLKIAVLAPDGNFCAYCGMWYDTEADCAVIEPLACDPRYRRMGLAKAAVLEGIKRVALLGADAVVVGSSQQFYYSIGMRPYTTATKWKRRP